MRAGVRGVVGAIRLYQRWISSLTPRHCRFEPTCSTYAVVAIERFGVAKGLRLAVARVARCHPWGSGGLDPVPPRSASS